AYASAQSAETTIDRAAAAYARLNSMRAEFRQTLTNPLTGTTQTVSGELIRRKPNLMSISFNNGDRVAADGSTLWVYLPSSVPGQVIRVPYTGGNAGSVDPADQFLNSPRTRYTVTAGGSAAVNGRATKILHLVPRRKNDPVAHATLWIDDKDYTVRQFEAESSNGLKRRVVITSFTPNPQLDRARFRFTVPRGAKVVDQSTIGAAF
ncbi:MAG: outer membrane lipoprotein carrier protein LolA, partial [Gemmatimonadota bacterium]|nr:outer membrane lipoprotein carrier protein LolA [Gemmatimonadota bacterium]